METDVAGRDSASVRYVFTELSSVTPLLFHPDDGSLLKYLDDDSRTALSPILLPEQYLMPSCWSVDMLSTSRQVWC